MPGRFKRMLAGVPVERSHFMAASFATTAGSAAVKLATGVMTGSILTLANALYNVVLCLPRFAAFARARAGARMGRCTVQRPLPATFSSERRTGMLMAGSLVALGVAFVLMSDYALLAMTGVRMGKIPAISFATCAFAKIGVAIYGVVRERGNRNAAVLAQKLTSLADGMASIVLTQMALRGLGRDGSGSASGAADVASDAVGLTADAVFGIVVGLVIVAMGVWLCLRLRRDTVGAPVRRSTCRRAGSAWRRPSRPR